MNSRRVPHLETKVKKNHNRWVSKMKYRLIMDCVLTDKGKFGRGAVEENLVKITWQGCLEIVDCKRQVRRGRTVCAR